MKGLLDENDEKLGDFIELKLKSIYGNNVFINGQDKKILINININNNQYEYILNNNGNVSGIIPNTYKKLLFIESSGSQYIDTGYYPKTDTKVELELSFSSEVKPR